MVHHADVPDDDLELVLFRCHDELVVFAVVTGLARERVVAPSEVSASEKVASSRRHEVTLREPETASYETPTNRIAVVEEKAESSTHSRADERRFD